jgi:hypothetical protein
VKRLIKDVITDRIIILMYHRAIVWVGGWEGGKNVIDLHYDRVHWRMLHYQALFVNIWDSSV